jgi:hypothetical protein
LASGKDMDENLIQMVDCHGITSETEFWERYVRTVQPEWAKRFRPSLEGFWDALNGGPGWPRECKLVFTGAAELEPIDGGRFLAGLREIVQKSRNSLVPVQLIET